MGHYSRTLKDYDGEKTVVSVNAPVLTPVNFADQITLQSNFGAAINDMALGSLQKISYGNDVISNLAPPADTHAQRELKWRVDYRDTVNGEPGHFTIGTANAELLDPNNRKQAYIGDGGDVDDFVTATEAYVLSKDGNPVEVVQILLVGRNT